MARLPTHVSALRRALAGIDQQTADGAAVRLAYEYAAQLDGDGDPVKVGPALLACLTALGMTPAARAAVTGKGGATSEPAPSPLDQLRQRRLARERHAATLDPAAS